MKERPTNLVQNEPSLSSIEYWEKRYAAGGHSGVGSYNRFAEFKADVVNTFVVTNGVNSVIEFGCGDGNQLEYASYPDYFGLDVSETAISLCEKRFAADANKRFGLLSEYGGETADLSLSLDVVFHLIEDTAFENYLRVLFEAGDRFVVVYSSDSDNNDGHVAPHVKHRKFSAWVKKNISGWKMKDHLPNKYPYRGDFRKGSFSEFFVYEKM